MLPHYESLHLIYARTVSLQSKDLQLTKFRRCTGVTTTQLVILFYDHVPLNKAENAVLRYVARSLASCYFQNVTRFHGTRVNVRSHKHT